MRTAAAGTEAGTAVGTEAAIAAAVQTVLDRWTPRLGANDASFMQRVHGTGGAAYDQRLAAIGFDAPGTALDAGCGYGQWTLGLLRGHPERQVTACDVDAGRVAVTQELAEATGAGDRVTACHARLESLPFEDASFDRVWCYGVLFCTPWRRSLAELLRVLRPGGRLYVNANDLGWTVQKWLNAPNRTSDYDPRWSAATDMANTLRHDATGEGPDGGQVLIRAEELAEAVVAGGGQVLGQGDEGTVTLDGRPAGPSFFAGTYEGLPGCHELVATR